VPPVMAPAAAPPATPMAPSLRARYCLDDRSTQPIVVTNDITSRSAVRQFIIAYLMHQTLRLVLTVRDLPELAGIGWRQKCSKPAEVRVHPHKPCYRPGMSVLNRPPAYRSSSVKASFPRGDEPQSRHRVDLLSGVGLTSRVRSSVPMIKILAVSIKSA
jgi:hypothetical protein